MKALDKHTAEIANDISRVAPGVFREALGAYRSELGRHAKITASLSLVTDDGEEVTISVKISDETE